MSETDDTDELLLIPPDFFQIPSELESTESYFDVVHTLINQVNSLRGRIRNIETGIDDSADSNFGDSIGDITINKRQMNYHGRGFKSAEDLAAVDDSISKGNSPVKEGRTAFNSLPSTPSTDRSVLRSYTGRHGSYSNPRNRYAIDTRYQTSTRVAYNASGRANSSGGAARNLSAEFDMHPIDNSNRQSHLNVYTSSPASSGFNSAVEHVIKGGAAVAKLTVEAIQDVAKGESTSGGSTLSPISGKSRESIETAIYQYNPQTPRHINFEDDETFRTARNILEVNKRLLDAAQYDRTKSNANTTSSINELKTNTVSTAATIHNTNSLSQNSNSFPGCSNTTNPCCKCDLSKNRHNVLEAELIEDAFASGNLFSLAELFNSRQTIHIGSLDMHHVRNKLTEEKLRRLHCEQIIQDLQTKTLELQQKFSVALEIDKNKTESIEQFQKTWTQIANRVKLIITERNKFEKDLYDIQTRTVGDLQEAAKKVLYHENEASKAFSLATKHHEKVVQNDAKMIEILAELENCKSTINKYENNIQIELKKNVELSKILGQKEIALNESKKVIADARSEIAHSEEAVEICQGEFTTMKSRYIDLEMLFHNKQDAMKHLESQNRTLSQENEKLKNVRCKHLEEELAKAKASMERNKSELREFYQSQLEVVVQEKLAQFQKQLDQAEYNLQNDMKNREQTIAETAAQHIQQLSNKHRTEIRLLEAKHSEQQRLQKLQLQQAQMQLREQQDRKQHIASQLHQMMEAQWREAVRIINSTKVGDEPTPGRIVDESAMLRMERLHQELNDRSRTNLEEMLQLNVNLDDPKRVRNDIETFPYRAAETVKYQDIYETQTTHKPTTSRDKELIDTDLQKCIDMLLNRPATIIAELPRYKENNSHINGQSVEESSSTELFNMAYTDRLKNTNANAASCSNHKSGKRPWK